MVKMEFSYFDIGVGIIILLLGLKGIINGFFKELFGLIGIIGGVFIASRFGNEVGKILSDTLLHISSETAINFTGFLITFALFWGIMVLIGQGFKRLSSISGLGPVDKIMGFVVGAGKFFLIISVMSYAFYNINMIRNNVQDTMHKSILFPIMVKTGSFIMKLDTADLTKELNATVEKQQDEIKNKIEEKIKENKEKAVQEIKETLKGDENSTTPLITPLNNSTK